MKAKSTTYLLLTVVVVIWGLVFYRVLNGLGSTDASDFRLPVHKSSVPFSQEEENIPVLLLSYRDPFLGAIAVGGKPEVSGTRKKTTEKKAEEVKPAPIDWSFLDYVGIVNNKETNKKVGLMVISGKEYMVSEKDRIGEVTILRKERDSVHVEYKGEKRWIRR